MTRIVVASGKGGTGKTLVATGLALVASEIGPTALVDADVEAPNAALFLHPEWNRRRTVEVMVPVVDQGRCTHCGRCAEVCAFHAIASLPDRTLVFSEMCHGCGSCALNCPAGAISEVPHRIGIIRAGATASVDPDDGIPCAEGELAIGEAMATPVIHALKGYATEAGWEAREWLIIDAPPGTACPVIETLRDADVALLVTEPTPFGLHDLRLAVNLARDVLHKPVGVVINKDDGLDAAVEAYCENEGLPVLLRLPCRREIAEAYSRGRPLVTALPEYRPALRDLLLGATALSVAATEATALARSGGTA